MTWAEIDLDAGVWTIAADWMKNGRPHRVPLTPKAVALLESLPRMARRGIRQDRHTLLTAVASYPVSTELVKATPEASAEYERLRDHNVAWLKATFGEKLVSVIAHWDEK